MLCFSSVNTLMLYPIPNIRFSTTAQHVQNDFQRELHIFHQRFF
jgi:hypothetical protein